VLLLSCQVLLLSIRVCSEFVVEKLGVRFEFFGFHVSRQNIESRHRALFHANQQSNSAKMQHKKTRSQQQQKKGVKQQVQ
jgi:hypothetical protein